MPRRVVLPLRYPSLERKWKVETDNLSFKVEYGINSLNKPMAHFVVSKDGYSFELSVDGYQVFLFDYPHRDDNSHLSRNLEETEATSRTPINRPRNFRDKYGNTLFVVTRLS